MEKRQCTTYYYHYLVNCCWFWGVGEVVLLITGRAKSQKKEETVNVEMTCKKRTEPNQIDGKKKRTETMQSQKNAYHAVASPKPFECQVIVSWIYSNSCQPHKSPPFGANGVKTALTTAQATRKCASDLHQKLNKNAICKVSRLTVLYVFLPLSLITRAIRVQERPPPVPLASLQFADVTSAGRVREHSALFLALPTKKKKEGKIEVVEKNQTLSTVCIDYVEVNGGGL